MAGIAAQREIAPDLTIRSGSCRYGVARPDDPPMEQKLPSEACRLGRRGVVAFGAGLAAGCASEPPPAQDRTLRTPWDGFVRQAEATGLFTQRFSPRPLPEGREVWTAPSRRNVVSLYIVARPETAPDLILMHFRPLNSQGPILGPVGTGAHELIADVVRRLDPSWTDGVPDLLAAGRESRTRRDAGRGNQVIVMDRGGMRVEVRTLAASQLLLLFTRRDDCTLDSIFDPAGRCPVVPRNARRAGNA